MTSNEAQMTSSFVPPEFEVPLTLECEYFVLEPLAPQHNDRDFKAWNSSIEHIRNTPGFPNGRWPYEMSLEENLNDMQRHNDDFVARRGFTYTVLDGDEIIGCVYIYPAKKSTYDVEVSSWVTDSRAELDSVLWNTVSKWLVESWPFERVLYEPR